ncbi:MAG TPA: hypothetical protein VGE74_16380 [Gemmata sp.]
MFKSVEYAGFEGRPELKARAEHAVTALAGIVRDWDKQIELGLEAYADQPAGVEITVTLSLPTASGSGSRFLTEAELQDDGVLESRCRSVWARAMDAYIDRRKPVWDEILKQPAEV